MKVILDDGSYDIELGSHRLGEDMLSVVKKALLAMDYTETDLEEAFKIVDKPNSKQVQ